MRVNDRVTSAGRVTRAPLPHRSVQHILVGPTQEGTPLPKEAGVQVMVRRIVLREWLQRNAVGWVTRVPDPAARPGGLAHLCRVHFWGATRDRRRYISTEENPADIFTKILRKQVFERHRKTILNLPGNAAVDFARPRRRRASYERDRTTIP